MLKRSTRLAVSLFFVPFAPALRALSQASPPPVYSYGPVTDYSAALPNASDVHRFRRGLRYNSPDSSGPELGEQSETVLIGADSVSFRRNPLPFRESDAVAVGIVTGGQAYLSDDKREIYSEFKFAVREILKVPTAHYIQAGDNIDILRRGGAVRLPSGKVIVRSLRDFSMPLVRKRYLLFLKYNSGTEDFDIVTGYQLEGEHTYKLDTLTHSQADSNNELIHPLRDQGENEEQLLNRVKAIEPHNQGES
jgi:hypothetical protein